MRFYKLFFVILFFLFSNIVFADNFFTQAQCLNYYGQSLYVKEKKKAGKNNLPIVVLLNSVSLPSVEAWDVPNYSLMDVLAEAGYDVWGFDFINQGRSDFSEKLPLSIENALKELDFVLQQIREKNKQKTIALLGWSWGTIVAAKYTIAHPQEVSHLILYAAMYSSSMPEPQQKMMTLPANLIPPTQHTFWPIIQRHWNSMLSDTAQEKNKTAMMMIARAYCDIEKNSDCSVTRLKEQMLDLMDSWTGKPKYRAEDIRVPTLIIYGSGDFFVDKMLFNRLINVPYKEQIVIQDASHWLIYEEKRTLLYQSLIHFLGTHD